MEYRIALPKKHIDESQPMQIKFVLHDSASIKEGAGDNASFYSIGIHSLTLFE
jgi:hypothetical protein